MLAFWGEAQYRLVLTRVDFRNLEATRICRWIEEAALVRMQH